MSSEHVRDLVGYGCTPPAADWPGGARLALNFVLNFEEGSEYSVPDGDGRSEATLTEVGAYDPKIGGRDLAAESMFEYGTRVGFWRVLRLFRERDMPMTIFGCALALERHPPACQAIVEAGYDVCCHGWRWVNQYDLAEAEEREHIRRAVASLTRSLGERPYGWYCRYGPGLNPRRLLVEEGGFVYDSDAYNDELPYWVAVGGRPHLVVPYTLSNNDAKFGLGSFGTSTDFYTYLKDSFDVLYEEGETQPRMMSVGLHLRLIGHPARAVGLERFLDYVLGHERIWVCRRLDIARHWIRRHPAGVQD
ncbi:MAG: allantoinase PuuE, partial [Phycisphaerales bacterium]|nr:allantoinase PuuE [Phycisphaerales bacterium]